MIDFGKYGKEKSTTASGTVVDWNNYGTPLTTAPAENVNKPFKYAVPETKAGKLSRYQQEATAAQDEAKKANSFTEKYLKPVADSVLPGVTDLGETIGGIINTKDLTKTYTDAVHNASTVQFNLIRKINENKKLGKDTTQLEQLYNEGVDQLLNLDKTYNEATKGAQKSTKQVAGELGMTALNALLFGTYGEATAGMQSGKLAVEGKLSGLLAKTGIPSTILEQSALPSAISKTTGLLTKPSSLFTREGLKNVALGTGIGEAFDITQNLQEDKSGSDILTGGYAKYIGGGIPLLTEGSKSIANKFSKDIARDELGAAYRDTIAKYVRPQTILDNSERINKTDPVGVLQMYGNKTVPTMTENGRVNPQEQIDFLKSKIKELSEVKNEAVFLNDNTITAEEYRKYVDGIVDAQKSWTDGKKLAEKKQVDKIFDEIAAAQGDKPFEMNQIDKIKTEQTGLSKSYNNPSTAFSYDAHGAIGKASRDLVEMFSDDTGVRDLNKLIQSHYDAIDILNSLKGKTPKGGMMSKHFSRVSGQILGYGAGSAVGHPFAGMAVGQILTNEIQSIVQSNFITNPLKRVLINNLKEQAPREVTAVLKSLEGKYGEIFDEMGLTRQPNSKPAGTQKLPPEAPSTVPPESYIKQGLREGKELGQILLNYAKDLKNKGGMSIRDVSKEQGKGFKVGLSAVKGRVPQPLDDLANQADKLVKEGKFEEAQKLFDKITQQAQKTIQSRFRGTGIEIKMEGTGFGVYKGNAEPNLDFIAIVKPGQEDLFHQILSDIANKDFLQESFVTYKKVQNDATLGILDKAKGIRNEPYLTYTFEKPLSLEEVTKVNKALADVGLEAMTLKNGNKTLDLLHLSTYNGEDYGKFIKQAGDFAENLNGQGLRGSIEHGTSETRFVGSDTSGANTTYKRSGRNFYAKNKGYINPDINSKVLDAIKYRTEVSKKELESIVNAGDVSPTEKAVFQEVLGGLKDGKVKSTDVLTELRGKLLTLEPKEVEKYASYGFDNLQSNFDKYKSVVFDSNLKHARGQGHFEAEGMFGHARYAMEYPVTKKGVGEKTSGGIASIGEVQSDVFQDNLTVQHIKNYYEENKGRLERFIDANDGNGALMDSVKEAKKELADLNKANETKDQQLLVDQFVNFARKDKYRDRLLQETINHINKTEKPKEIRIATPSTVAKIEGFVGGEDYAPYSIIDGGNGRVGRDAEDLTHGDTIDYGGETMIVVDTPAYSRGWGGAAPTNIVVAPEDKVQTFDLSSFISDEIENKVSEVEAYMKKYLPDDSVEVTPEKAKELLKDGVDDWALEKELENISEGESMTVRELQNKVFGKIDTSENENAWDNLTSIYGEDHVFGHEHRRYDTKVYVVEDGVNTETLGQPNSYSTNLDDMGDVDNDRKAAADVFDKTQMGVLESYYKIKDEFIPKLEKILGKKIETVSDDNGNTWLQIPAEDLKKTQFGSVPIGVLLAGAGIGAVAAVNAKIKK